MLTSSETGNMGQKIKVYGLFSIESMVVANEKGAYVGSSFA